MIDSFGGGGQDYFVCFVILDKDDELCECRWNAYSSTLLKKQAENIVGATVTATKTLNRLASARAELKAEACPLGTLGAP